MANMIHLIALFKESENSLRHELGKALLSYNCLCGTVVESLFLTQETLGFNRAFFLFDLNFLSLHSVNLVKAFR